MAKNILRKQFGPMYGRNKPYHVPEPLPEKISEPMTIEQPSITLTTVILFTLIVLLGLMVYLNRVRLYDLLQNVYKDFQPKDKLDELEQKYHDLSNNVFRSQNLEIEDKLLREIERSEKKILDTIEQKEKTRCDTEKKQESSGVHQIQAKINRYSNEQMVKGNGFCYIGYDKNQRECTNVYEGDICMSGQIFPTMAVCLNPHLRP